MKPVIIIVIAFVLIAGISITSISAQSQYEIPAWVKGIAGFWAEDKISDSEFGEGLAFLIDNEIIKVPIIHELESNINQLQSENNRLKGEITNLERQNIDLQNKLNQPVTTTPKTNYENIQTPKSDLNYPKVTKRINGDKATQTILALFEFDENLTRTQKNELINSAVDQSQFTVGISHSGNWNLIVIEGNFDFIEYDGLGVSVIPFDCSHNMDYIYSIVGSKIDESGKITLWLFKNGVMIDSNTSEKPYGTVAMGGVCDEPSIVTSFG